MTVLLLTIPGPANRGHAPELSHRRVRQWHVQHSHMRRKSSIILLHQLCDVAVPVLCPAVAQTGCSSYYRFAQRLPLTKL